VRTAQTFCCNKRFGQFSSKIMIAVFFKDLLAVPKSFAEALKRTHTHTHCLKKNLFFVIFFKLRSPSLVESKSITKKNKKAKKENSFYCQQTLLFLARTTILVFVNCFTLKLFTNFKFVKKNKEIKQLKQ
jgi:hypothetical protein